MYDKNEMENTIRRNIHTMNIEQHAYNTIW